MYNRTHTQSSSALLDKTRISKINFPIYSQNNKNIDFHKMSGQPLSKKPKLDIDRGLSPSCSNVVTKGRGRDMIDDIWGDDLDITALEKVDFEEYVALSQMPETVTIQQPSQSNNNHSLHPQWGAAGITPAFKGNDNIPGLTNGKWMPQNLVKNSPRVPLRRTASSGWPAATNFLSSQSRNSANVRQTADKLDQKNITITLSRNDYEELKIEIANLKEQSMRKTGEVNLIRGRLNSVQKELNQQKNDYVAKIQAEKQEAVQNYNLLTKEIKCLKGQLDVKTMEFETAERRAQHLSSLNRLNPESPNNRLRTGIRPVYSPARTSEKPLSRENQLVCGRGHMKAKMFTLPLELLRQLITPELLRPTQTEASINESIRTITKPSLFSGLGSKAPKVRPGEPSTSTSHSSKTQFYTAACNVVSEVKQQISIPCTSVEPCSLSLLSSQLLDITSDNSQQTISQVLETCHNILKNQLHQLESAVCRQNKYLEREREILHHGRKYLMLTKDYNLLSSKELYNNERGICTRRTLALISLLVDLSDFAARRILPCCMTDELGKKNGESTSTTISDVHNMLITTRDIVCTIEKQRRTLMFEGVLAGAAGLVRSLLQIDLELSHQSQELVFMILQGVVFSRPGSLVLYNILQALLAAVKYPGIMDSLCHNSVKKTFVEDTLHSYVTYTSDSCVLQVLLVLVQVADCPRKHVLSDLYCAWVLALFYGGPRTPRWLFSVPSQTSCRCRPFVSRLTFTLLGEACLLHPKLSDSSGDKNFLEELLTRGILLVSTLLYHDEHFGANVDPASVGYYELFLHSMNKMDIKLNSTHREILESLCIQESLRQPLYSCEQDKEELNTLLETLSCS